MYHTRSHEVRSMDVMVHAGIPSEEQIHCFASYMQSKYGLYQQKTFTAASIITYNAKDQYQAMLNEMRNNVTWYDPIFSTLKQS